MTSPSGNDLRDWLVEGLTDYIGLWQLKPPSGPPYQLREQTLATVRAMLLSGWFQTGQLTKDGGFEASGESPEWTLARIARDWAVTPDPGAYEMSVWFALTSEGEERARALK